MSRTTARIGHYLAARGGEKVSVNLCTRRRALHFLDMFPPERLSVYTLPAILDISETCFPLSLRNESSNLGLSQRVLIMLLPPIVTTSSRRHLLEYQ